MISQSPEANLSFSSSVRREFAPQVDVLGGFLSVPEWMFFWWKGFFGVDRWPGKGTFQTDRCLGEFSSPPTALPGFGPLGRWSRHTQHSKCAEKGQGLPRGRDVLAEARRSLGRILADTSKTLGFNLGCQWLVTTRMTWNPDLNLHLLLESWTPSMRGVVSKMFAIFDWDWFDDCAAFEMGGSTTKHKNPENHARESDDLPCHRDFLIQ